MRFKVSRSMTLSNSQQKVTPVIFPYRMLLLVNHH